MRDFHKSATLTNKNAVNPALSLSLRLELPQI